MRRAAFSTFLGLVCCLAGVPARADLYQAIAAAHKQDYSRAFELYRELAELGHPQAQESLAVFYVNGDGVKRDNFENAQRAQSKAVGIAKRLGWDTASHRARLRDYEQGRGLESELVTF